MGRRIAIIGAGQAGLQLALGLASADQEVTLVTDRSGEEIRNGRVLSTQCMFGESLATERDLGIDFWREDCPQIPGIRYSLGEPDGNLALQFGGKLRAPAQSVDQRLKMPRWLEELERRGGEIVYRDLDLEYVESLARDYDLLVIASAKGAFGKLLPEIFQAQPEYSPYSSPQRQLAVAYVHDMEPLDPPYFSICIVPGVGEFFVGPALTLSGPCYTLCFEAIPGGDMDRWGDVPLDDVDRHLAVCLEVLERYFPWEAERCQSWRLTDDLGVLKGALTPVVRERVGRLPSGAPVLGVGDAVVLNDPLVGQGANNAAKGTTVVTREILDRGQGAFDAEWMRQAGDRYWETVRFAARFTNMMLSPPPHVADLFGAANENPALADHLANGTNTPATLFPWIMAADGVEGLARELAPVAPVGG
ncbi:MAG: FAD-binding oxidoreductase [Actinobacteria bacterium]|nr:FAD-binding oxidoreductase [Actinomycetota bacterium]